MPRPGPLWLLRLKTKICPEVQASRTTSLHTSIFQLCHVPGVKIMEKL